MCVCGDSILLWAQHPHNHIHHLESSLNPNIYELLRFQETGLIDWSIGVWSLIWISACPSSRSAETTNLYSPHWVLSIQSWVFGIPQCMVIKLYSGNHHLTHNRVNFKSFRRPASWNRKRVNHGKDNNSQKTTGKGPETLQYSCFHPTSSFTMLLPGPLPLPSPWFNVFWFLVIIQE